MGVPKTGVFGLYDLIGVDLMSDVVISLASTLPADDAFHAVSAKNDMIAAMIADGFTGDKGKGGFYMTGADDIRMARPLTGTGEALAAYRVASDSLPDAAINAAQAMATRAELGTCGHCLCGIDSGIWQTIRRNPVGRKRFARAGQRACHADIISAGHIETAFAFISGKTVRNHGCNHVILGTYRVKGIIRRQC